MDSKYQVVGAANCPHKSPGYGTMTVIVYAGGFEMNAAGTSKVGDYAQTLK